MAKKEEFDAEKWIKIGFYIGIELFIFNILIGLITEIILSQLGFETSATNGVGLLIN